MHGLTYRAHENGRHLFDLHRVQKPRRDAGVKSPGGEGDQATAYLTFVDDTRSRVATRSWSHPGPERYRCHEAVGAHARGIPLVYPMASRIGPCDVAAIMRLHSIGLLQAETTGHSCRQMTANNSRRLLGADGCARDETPQATPGALLRRRTCQTRRRGLGASRQRQNANQYEKTQHPPAHDSMLRPTAFPRNYHHRTSLSSEPDPIADASADAPRSTIMTLPALATACREPKLSGTS